MKRFACLLILSAAAFAAARVSVQGVIHSNQCVGAACATQCPINKDPVYTLQTEDRAWVLTDSKVAAPLAGKRVTIIGTAQGNTLIISSIKPVQ
jgi:hypothetical protein